MAQCEPSMCVWVRSQQHAADIAARMHFQASWDRMVLLAALEAANNAGDLPAAERHKARQQPNLAVAALAQRMLKPRKVQLAAPIEEGGSP